MSNLTLCFDKKCPLKDRCLRFNNPIAPAYQYVFGESPYDKENNKCNFYKKK